MDWKIPAETIQKAKLGIVNTISQYVELKKKGSEFVACCPFHSEKTPSFTVTPHKEAFFCFGCGVSGDATDFVMQFEGVGFREAVQRIVGNMPSSGTYTPPAKAQEPDEWQPVVPVPADIKQKPMSVFNRRSGDGWERLTVNKAWKYRDANGQLMGYVCRFDLPTGGKDVIPQTYCVNIHTGEMRWRWLSFGKPRPLYGLDKLAAHPNAQVMVTEGEKACDAAQLRYEEAGITKDKLITISWPGGGKAVKHIDWSPLDGRTVGLWPDADQKPYPDNHPLAGQLMPFGEQPGTQAMVDIAGRINGRAKAIKFIMPPAGVPDGWDLADPFPDGFNLLAHTKSAAVLWDEFRSKFSGAVTQAEESAPEDEQAPLPAELPPAAPVAAPDDPTEEHHNDLVTNGHFAVLGYDGDDYFFFHHEKRQVLSRTKSDFSDSGMIELAPINWWEEHFPGEKGINKKAAINWIFRTANSRGIYDPTRVRGRGAWTDKGRIVYHHGGYLTVDGVRTDITRIKSGYVYPMARSMMHASVTPLSDAEGAWLIEVAGMPRWSTPGSASLMAGWVMLAAISGAITWRPHIWITGAAGSGKSSIQKSFCAGLTRGFNVYANGNSTEAGVRQELKCDALPVIIDEFESNNEHEKKRVESVISLIRQTSTETQAKTLKGTVTGDGVHYEIRSMFCLASINTNLPTKADVDRMTVLALRPPTAVGADNWFKLEGELTRIEEDLEISGRLLSRALSMMPVIMQTVKLFRRIAAKQFGRQRDGDQYGTLLAGCWCLHKSYVPGEEEAAAFIAKHDWSEHREESDTDEALRALEAVLAAKMRVAPSGEFSVYEVVREASSIHRKGVIDQVVANDTLRRHGIRAEFGAGELWFGTSVSSLKHLVEHMPFVTDLRGQLLRVAGAKRVVGTKKFNGVDSKCVSVPIDPILTEAVGGGR